MTSPIDQLLARTRLVNEPYPPEEINAAAERIAARAAARRATPHPPERPGPAPEGPQDVAAQDLRTLCETAVMSSGALASLKRFVARSLPEPPGARVLGCILQLTEQEDSARFWWQYAAGAGDNAATYCLYLHHMAHGEEPEADWWHTQTAEAADENSQSEAEPQEFATTLRVLRGLKETEPVPDLASRAAQVSAVLNYVPAAVSYVDDDLDLPLPDADFTDRITSLTTQPTTQARPQRPRTSTPLPETPTRPTTSLYAAAARPTGLTRQPSATTPTAPPRWKWNDSGGAFGYMQRVGTADLAAQARRQHAMQAFWQHCEGCADCDPAGIPCPAHKALCPGPP